MWSLRDSRRSVWFRACARFMVLLMLFGGPGRYPPAKAQDTGICLTDEAKKKLIDDLNKEVDAGKQTKADLEKSRDALQKQLDAQKAELDDTKGKLEQAQSNYQAALVSGLGDSFLKSLLAQVDLYTAAVQRAQTAAQATQKAIAETTKALKELQTFIDQLIDFLKKLGDLAVCFIEQLGRIVLKIGEVIIDIPFGLGKHIKDKISPPPAVPPPGKPANLYSLSEAFPATSDMAVAMGPLFAYTADPEDASFLGARASAVAAMTQSSTLLAHALEFGDEGNAVATLASARNAEKQSWLALETKETPAPPALLVMDTFTTPGNAVSLTLRLTGGLKGFKSLHAKLNLYGPYLPQTLPGDAPVAPAAPLLFAGGAKLAPAPDYKESETEGDAATPGQFQFTTLLAKPLNGGHIFAQIPLAALPDAPPGSVYLVEVSNAAAVDANAQLLAIRAVGGSVSVPTAFPAPDTTPLHATLGGGRTAIGDVEVFGGGNGAAQVVGNVKLNAPSDGITDSLATDLLCLSGGLLLEPLLGLPTGDQAATATASFGGTGTTAYGAVPVKTRADGDGLHLDVDLSALKTQDLAGDNPDMGSGALTFLFSRTYTEAIGEPGKVRFTDRVYFNQGKASQTATGETNVFPSSPIAQAVKGGPVTLSGSGQIDPPPDPEDATWHLTLNANLASVAPEVSLLMPGDMNADGAVDVSDAVVQLRTIVGLTEPDLPTLVAGDVDHKGGLNIGDVVLTLQVTVGILSDFPSVDPATGGVSTDAPPGFVARSGIADPPCANGTLLVRFTRWECRKGYWALVTYATYQCPDGNKTVEEDAIFTSVPC